jgi:hypothetical protein
MDVTTLREQLEGWINATFSDEATGAPLDAKLDMDFVGGGRGHLIGRIPEGKSEPEGGMRTRVIDLKFSFLSHTPFRILQAFAEAMKARLERDPTLGGRMNGDRVWYRELHVERGKGTYGDDSCLVTVTIAHESIE